MYYIIRQVLAREPRLRLVVIGTTIEWEGHQENLSSERSVAWHDARATLLASTVVLRKDKSFVRRNDDVNRHLSIFFSRQTHHGRAVRWVASLLGQPSPGFDLGAHACGFLALDEDSDPTLAIRRAQFVQNRQDYHDAVAKRRRRDRVWTPCASVEDDQVQSLVRRLTSRGVEVMFFHSPVLNAEVPAWQEAAPEVPYFVFSDPLRLPELYEFSKRFDANHMNSGAAAEFTLALADSVAFALQPR